MLGVNRPLGVWVANANLGCVPSAHGGHWPLQRAIPEHARPSLIPCIGSKIEHLRYIISFCHDDLDSRRLLYITPVVILPDNLFGPVWLQHITLLSLAPDLFSVWKVVATFSEFNVERCISSGLTFCVAI